MLPPLRSIAPITIPSVSESVGVVVYLKINELVPEVRVNGILGFPVTFTFSEKFIENSKTEPVEYVPSDGAAAALIAGESD